MNCDGFASDLDGDGYALLPWRPSPGVAQAGDLDDFNPNIHPTGPVVNGIIPTNTTDPNVDAGRSRRWLLHGRYRDSVDSPLVRRFVVVRVSRIRRPPSEVHAQHRLDRGQLDLPRDGDSDRAAVPAQRHRYVRSVQLAVADAGASGFANTDRPVHPDEQRLDGPAVLEIVPRLLRNP